MAHRIDTKSAVGTLPAVSSSAAGNPGFFTDGDPSTGEPATVVSDDWLNSVQEEIASVVEAAELTLDKTNNAQMLAAIKLLVPGLVDLSKQALKSDLATEQQRAEEAEAAIFQLPVGAPILWGSNIIPAGMILYDGRSFPAAGNPQLAALYPSLTVPDMRGLVPRGYDPTGIHDPHGPTRGLLSFQDGTYMKGPDGDGWYPVTFGSASFPGNDQGLDYASTTTYAGWLHNAQPAGGAAGMPPFNTGTSQLGLYGTTRMKNRSWNFIARVG